MSGKLSTTITKRAESTKENPPRGRTNFGFRLNKIRANGARHRFLPMRTVTTQTPTVSPAKARLARRGGTYLSPTRLQHRQGGRSQERRPLRGEGEALAPGLGRDAEAPVRVAVLRVELDDAARRRHAHNRPPMQPGPWKNAQRGVWEVGSGFRSPTGLKKGAVWSWLNTWVRCSRGCARAPKTLNS